MFGRRTLRLVVAAGVGAMLTLGAARARAEVSEASERPDQQFDFMNLITRHGLHDLHDESWNAYGQITYISSWKLPFSAKYTNLNGTPNSLTPDAERSWTGSATLYIGGRLWPGGEVYFAPEVIAEVPLSQLRGLGGAIQNFELQKTGSSTPQMYRSRVYLQQMFELGGERTQHDSNPQYLGKAVDARRLVLRVGNFAINDFLDKNTFAGDLRQQFFNMAFLTYAAYDFAADARGFSWGGVAELYWDDWAFRVGRMAVPQDPNQLPLDFRIDRFYGDQAEIEHTHHLFGKEGVVRVLAYRNRENMGRFEEAIAAYDADPARSAANAQASCPGFAYGSANAGAPDLCWVRRPNVKVGIGLNLEQHLTETVGVFFRGMYSDGRTEVYSFTSTDRSLSFGVSGKGRLWHRPADVAGVGVGLGWISKEHADYLRRGGIDGFIGDGALNAATESVLEAFYSFKVLNAVWLSGDYQHITNPAFNADRGPVDVFGARLHAEF